MKALCVMESASRVDGGVFVAERTLQRMLAIDHGVKVEVVGLHDQFSEQDRDQWTPLAPRFARVAGPPGVGYSPTLPGLLDAGADLAYSATLWRYPSMAVLHWHEKTRKPMIAAPHGSLDPWALRHSRVKKALASMLYKRAQLAKSACLRALCSSEVDALRAFGLRNPVCLIPNGIDLPAEPATPAREFQGAKLLLFLGRLNPKKGLPAALRAWARSGISRAGWKFVIAGWDNGGHEALLNDLCRELGLKVGSCKEDRHGVFSEPGLSDLHPLFQAHTEEDVVLFGPALRNEKDALLRSADACILPSLSEGLPMAVLEAWAYGLPMIMTDACNLPEGFESGAAIRVTSDEESIAAGLDEMLKMSAAERATMGSSGRRLVTERFNTARTASDMKAVYDWVLGGGPPPPCVEAGR